MAERAKDEMLCGACGETMQSGYVWLASSYPAELQWQEEKPKLSAWRFWKMCQGERILSSNTRMFPRTLRRAHRCPKCQTLTVLHLDKELDRD